MNSEKLKENIIKEINRLSDESLREVDNFVSFIVSKSDLRRKKKRNYNKRRTQNSDIIPKKARARQADRLGLLKDPLLNYIGSIQNGSLASNIDRELYGDAG